MTILDLPHPTPSAFRTLEDVFQCLNAQQPRFQYVALYNFDNDVDKFLDQAEDLDLLVNDYYAAKRLLGARDHLPDNAKFSSLDHGGGMIRNSFNVGSKKIMVDLRFVGDKYFTRQWQKHILESRQLVNGFYVPNSTHQAYTLLYHATVHKASISRPIKERLRSLFGLPVDTLQREGWLKQWMSKQNYSCARPSDAHVLFHQPALACSMVEPDSKTT